MCAYVDKNKYAKYLSYFNRDAAIEHNGKTYKATEIDFSKLNIRGNYWHTKTDPSTWLTTATVRHFKIKFGKTLPASKIVELAARVLNVDDSSIKSALDWNARYTSWHDGGNPEDYHVLPDSDLELNTKK